MRMPAEIPSRKLQPSRRIAAPQNHLLQSPRRACRQTSCLPCRSSMTTS